MTRRIRGREPVVLPERVVHAEDGGPGNEEPEAAEVERRDPIDDDDVGPGGALERTPIVVASARPWERGAVRVGGVGGREDMDGRRLRPILSIADRPQPIEGARERELRSAQTVDEVPAPDPARLLERTQDRIDRGKAALEPFCGNRLAGPSSSSSMSVARSSRAAMGVLFCING